MNRARSWKLSDPELETVIRLPAGTRNEYAIKRIADWGTVWLLGRESRFVQYQDDEGENYLPIWPHQRYAGICVPIWGDVEAVPVPAGRLLRGELLPLRNLNFAVFPLTDHKGWLIRLVLSDAVARHQANQSIGHNNTALDRSQNRVG